MDIVLTILLFVLGLVLIIKGGDFFVDAATWIAEKSGIPKFIIGATIVSFATTLPELIASIVGTINGSIGIATGNAIGSVTANTGLIMAISIIAIPAIIKRKEFTFKSILLIVITSSLWLLTLNNKLQLWNSIVLFGLFIAFIWENIHSAKLTITTETNNNIETNAVNKKKELVINILKFIFGVSGIVIGAELLINKGQELAIIIGVSEAVIGLTFVAIGTSLPELVTTITAIIKKQSSLSVGNIIGANIIDMAIILPICSFVQGGNLPVENRTIYLDLPISLIIMAIAIIPTIIRKKFSRFQGILMLLIYIGYCIYIAIV